jgi:hypothetical protein
MSETELGGRCDTCGAAPPYGGPQYYTAAGRSRIGCTNTVACEQTFRKLTAEEHREVAQYRYERWHSR